jgi:hypothetical protein
MTKLTGIDIGLNAVVVAVTNEQPRVLVVKDPGEQPGASDSFPFGFFNPQEHRTLESGLRAWVSEQTNLDLGHIEQLYTFGDRGRDPSELSGGPRVVSVAYIALSNEALPGAATVATWQNWYHYLPWEDWRDGEPPVFAQHIKPKLAEWVKEVRKPSSRKALSERVELAFAFKSGQWNEELVLERYELLYEAKIVAEARRELPQSKLSHTDEVHLGAPMLFDHRRIAATALGRLRGKIKYRPLIFELMPPKFTLLQLQRAVEALAGKQLHKQNFRRLIADRGLVEESGTLDEQTGGRPAKQFQFRRNVLLERLSPGVK